ncbi:MAG: creatininase family protein [Gammaproteobacteria bacterium]|nr:creatininase family protein [Gammaproteobacteria bacterium]
MSAESRGAFVARLSWPEVERRMQAGAVAVLPVGAACKEHGPHLPMNADFLQAEWLAAALAQHATVLVWPTLAYGHYPAFTDYPGSVSLGRETFERMVREILSDIRRAGARAALILNTGISTIAPLETVAGAMPDDLRVALAYVYDGSRCRDEIEQIEQQPRGGHADEIETSILLAIAPDRVTMDLAEAWTPPSMAGGGRLSRGEPDDPRYSPSGIYGDPTRATEEKGRRVLAAMVEDLLAAVGDLHSSARAGR